MIIYKFTSPSGKSYIGMTTTTIENRWKQHVTKWDSLKRKGIIDYRGHGSCPLLYFAFDKYPPEQWTQTKLFEAIDIKELELKEMELIAHYDTIKNGYNILTGGQRGNYGRNLDSAQRQAIAISATDYWNTVGASKRKIEMSERFKTNNPGKAFTGNHTDESKVKISKGNKGKIRSEEYKMGVSERTKEAWKNGSFDNRPPMSREAIERARETRRGFTQSDYQKAKATEANSQTWKVTFPDGHTETITNLRQFCKTHGLSQGNLSTSGKTKGFKAEKI